ncbi:hypothetical protein ZWY2020_006178 [Hordeum vulgare]|nr:hypothetical protein ZWY2020_006178 [Hordeum vulgare]
MDASIGWQKAVQDLAGDNEEIREQLREITGWFPSIEMMRNHARGLIKVMREDKKVVDVPLLKDDGTAAVSYTSCLEDGEGPNAVIALPAAVHEPDVQVIPPVFTAKKKKVVKQEVLDEAGDKEKKKKKREPKKKVLGVVIYYNI